MRLITRQLAEGHLRRSIPSSSPPSNAEVDLLAKIEQAEALVLDFVNQRRIDGDLWAAEVESWDANVEDSVPPQVQAAVLVQLKELDRFRGDDTDADQPKREPGIVLHPRAAAYLHRHRDPAIA
jgi:hypothetical protein